MKKIYSLFSVPFLFSFAFFQISQSKMYAQTFQVDTIFFNGNTYDPSKSINFVFMSDGFQASEFLSYKTNVQGFAAFLFDNIPFKEYKNYFNVFAINVPSVQSGADHPRTAPDCPSAASHPVQTVNTYFNSTFDYASIHRLLVPVNSSAINTVLINNFPQYDQKLILVNSPYYGGSGGSNATASLDPFSFEVMIHEVGHSFALLADEYYAGDGYASEKPNMTQNTNPLTVKWKNWIGFNGVGIYSHAGSGGNSANWYRPHQGCKMRYLGSAYPFCAVCTETIIERIHTLFGSPVVAKQPSITTITYCSQPISFDLTTIKPVPNTLRIKWKLNGNTIMTNVESITINSGQLNTGSNTLSAEVLDTTSLSRSDSHFQTSVHTYSVNWTINYNPSNIDDGNACTTDICNTSSGATHSPVNTNDNNECTIDGCNTATGVFHNPVNTDDGDPCTTDGCNTATGIFHNPTGSCGVTLSSTIFIQSFYTGGGLMDNFGDGGYLYVTAQPGADESDADTIVISAMDPGFPFALVDEQRGVLQTDGSIFVTFNPSVIAGNSYYIKVNHQNSVETWSAAPVVLSGLTAYSFSSAATQAFGNNLVITFDNLYYAIFNGDINQDGAIDGSDFLELDQYIQNGEGGYMIGDLNGDGAVDGADFLFLDTNVQNGIGASIP